MKKIKKKNWKKKVAPFIMGFFLIVATIVPFFMNPSYITNAATKIPSNIETIKNAGKTNGSSTTGKAKKTGSPSTTKDLSADEATKEKFAKKKLAKNDAANSTSEKKTSKNTASASDGTSSSSWLNGNTDDAIYGGNGSATKIGEDEEEDKKPGIVAGLFIDLLVDITDWIQVKMKNIGMSLDSIVLGRVGGNGVAWNGYRVALFTFEMRPGNPYGVVASAVYNTIRSILYIIITLIVLAKIVMAAYAGGSTKALGALKEAISSYIVAIMMLTLMPYLFDVLLYIRDVILYVVTSKLGSDVLGLDVADLSLVDMFKDIASNSIMNAFMYFGTIVLTLWFAMTYIGLAMGYIVYFFAFPFVCMNMQFDKNALGEWWKQMVYSMLIPISDIVLLFIPLAFGALGNTASIHVLQFLICTMLVPARAQLRNAMGIRTNMGMEMAGIATLMGAAAFARSAVGTTARVGAGIAGAASDRRMGKMYEEMGRNERVQKQEYADMYNRENGYGFSFDKESGKFVPGSKEVQGVDSLSTGIAGLSKSYGLPTGAIDSEDSYNRDSSSIMPDALGGGAGSGLGGANQELLDKYANVTNFENPEFKGISADRKAELYKQRSRRRAAQAVSTAVGGAVGAGMGLGATSFFSMGTKAQMAGLGMSAGAGIGSAVPGMVAGSVSAAGRGIAAAGQTAHMLGAYSQLTGTSLPSMAASAAVGAAQGVAGDIQSAADFQSTYGSLSNYFSSVPMPGYDDSVAAAEQEFSSNMDAINTVTEQSLDLNGYLSQATSPNNQELSDYMDRTYSQIMENRNSYSDVNAMRQEMSNRCVEHVMGQAEPYFAQNISGKENVNREILDGLIENRRHATNQRVSDDLSPENISKYGNGKYTFQ